MSLTRYKAVLNDRWMLQERERTVCAQRFAFHFSVISAFSIFIFPFTAVRCAAYRRSSFARRGARRPGVGVKTLAKLSE